MIRCGLDGSRALLGLIAVVGTSGCAFEPGEPYGLVAATLDGRYEELGERATPDGFEHLDTDFQVRLTSASLLVAAVELVDAGTSAEAPVFDPANPPPGYSLCHGGHCHADDGSLVEYEVIAAELASASGITARTVLTMTPGAVDLLSRASLTLGCEPDCAVGEGRLVLARLIASRLVLQGQVRDSRAEARIAGVADWQVDLPLLEHHHAADEQPVAEDEHDHDEAAEGLPGVFELPLELPIAEDELPHIALAFSLLANAELLERVDFGSVTPTASGVVDLDGAGGEAARAELAESVAATEVSVAVARSEEEASHVH